MCNKYKVSDWVDENVLEIDGVVAQQSQWHRTVHLNIIEMVNFVLCIFCYNKKETIQNYKKHLKIKMKSTVAETKKNSLDGINSRSDTNKKDSGLYDITIETI